MVQNKKYFKIYILLKIFMLNLCAKCVAENVPEQFEMSNDLQYMDLLSDFNYQNDICVGDCKKLDFIVNFTEIGWEKWILHPRTFNAYYCSGQCPVPLKYNQNTFGDDSNPQITNHAQIMSILEYMDPNVNKKMTNCVPTKLDPLEIIVLNDNGEIEMRTFDNMIVKQCGCR